MITRWHYFLSAVMITRWWYCLSDAMITRWLHCLNAVMIARWQYCFSDAMITRWRYCLNAAVEMVTGWVRRMRIHRSTTENFCWDEIRSRDWLNVDVGIFGHAPSIIVSTTTTNAWTRARRATFLHIGPISFKL